MPMRVMGLTRMSIWMIEQYGWKMEHSTVTCTVTDGINEQALFFRWYGDVEDVFPYP